MTWQPISTAPLPAFNAEKWWRLSFQALVWCGYGPTVATFSYTRTGKGRWRDHGGVVIPTHWMPLPEPPEPQP